jgi:hypothetical protein
LDHHWSLSNDGAKIKLSKEKKKIIFDKVMDTDTGCIPGVILKSILVDQAYHAVIQNWNNQIEINHFHKLWLHPGK